MKQKTHGQYEVGDEVLVRATVERISETSCELSFIWCLDDEEQDIPGIERDQIFSHAPAVNFGEVAEFSMDGEEWKRFAFIGFEHDLDYTYYSNDSDVWHLMRKPQPKQEPVNLTNGEIVTLENGKKVRVRFEEVE